jgi:hypothetical protein
LSDLYLAKSLDCTFVDPHPELFLGLLSPEERSQVHVIASGLQDTDLGLFRELRPGGLLFIDSSHVAKTGSDVNHLFFEILPVLAAGVFVHIHDIYFPFEYPEEWVYTGRGWNEAYLLHAFLQYNSEFRIRLWNDYLATLKEGIEIAGPKFAAHWGSSLWLEKTTSQLWDKGNV